MRSLHPCVASPTPSSRPSGGRLLRAIGLLLTFTLILTGFGPAPSARAEETRYSPQLVLSSGNTIAAGHSYTLTVKGLPDDVERVRIVNDPNGLPTATKRNDAGDFELHGRIHVLRPLGSYRWQVEVTADDGYQERFPFEFVVTEPDQFTIKPLITLTPGSLRPGGDFRLSLDNLPAKASYRLTSLAESDPIGLSSGTTTAQGGMVSMAAFPPTGSQAATAGSSRCGPRTRSTRSNCRTPSPPRRIPGSVITRRSPGRPRVCSRRRRTTPSGSPDCLPK